MLRQRHSASTCFKRLSTTATTLILILLSILMPIFISTANGQAARQRSTRALPAGILPCASTIAYGETISCSISLAAEVDSATFSGTTGAVVLVRVGATAGELTPYVQISGPSSGKLCEAGSAYNDGAEISRCVLTESGIHTITIADYRGTRVGNYNLYFQNLSAPAGAIPLTLGDTAVSTITAAAEANSFGLTAAANDVVLLRAGVAAGTLTPLVRVFGLDGAEICAAGNSYSTGVEISRCPLPQAGNYTVLVGDARATRNGTYNLYIQRLTAPVGAPAIGAGETNPASIAMLAEADSYTFVASAGDVVMARVATTSGTMTPFLRIIDANGVVLCAAGNSYSAGATIDRCPLPQTGSYTFMVADASATRTGSYNLYLQRVTKPVGANLFLPGTTANATIAAAAAMRSYTLVGRAGDAMLVRIGVTAGTMTPFISIYDPDGIVLCAAGNTYSAGAEIGRCVLPRDGSYTLQVGDASATRTGSYAIYLQRLTDPIAASLIADGETRSGVLATAATATTYLWLAGDHDTLRVRMATTSGALNPFVRVYDPEGIAICGAGTSYSASAEINTCLLPRSGRYTILATDATVRNVGSYNLSVSCLAQPCGSQITTSITPTGGLLELGELQISVPPNAFTQPVSITLARLENRASAASGGFRPLHAFFVQARTADGQIITRTQALVTYRIRYTDGELVALGVDAAKLHIGLWDEQGQQWDALDSQLDASSTILTALSYRIESVASLRPGEQLVYLPLTLRN